MNTRIALFTLFAFSTSIPAAELQEVASFPDQQITGVGVSQKSGRIFVNFPFWSDDHSISVAEIVNGRRVHFPMTSGTSPAHPFHTLSACKASSSTIGIISGS